MQANRMRLDGSAGPTGPMRSCGSTTRLCWCCGLNECCVCRFVAHGLLLVGTGCWLGGVQVVFYVVSGALLAGFIALRNVQPFKFRDVRTVFIFWFILVANMTTLVVVGNMVRLRDFFFVVYAAAIGLVWCADERVCAVLGCDNRAAQRTPRRS